MTFNLLNFQRARVCFPRAYCALELRNGLDLPSAALMHANLPLASQENNFSHSTNKVQTPPPPPPPPNHPECWQRGTVQTKHMHEKARQSAGVSCRSLTESRLRRTLDMKRCVWTLFKAKKSTKSGDNVFFFFLLWSKLNRTQFEYIWIHITDTLTWGSSHMWI